MRKLWYALAALVAVALPTVAIGAADPGTGKSEAKGLARAHNLKHPLGTHQATLRAKAIQAKLDGKIAKDAKVAQVAKGQFVQLQQTGTDRIFVVLAEFGDTVDSATGGTAGPLHNQISQPDRSVDNSTIWQADFNRAHYQDMYFNRMDAFYKAQSSGRYGVAGSVVDWVRVPRNEAYYGSNTRSDAYVWYLIRDAIKQWTTDRLASGMTLAQVQAELRSFDVQDRYDWDGDGRFNEPDGYIDHFQIVHAGAGEETGGGAQGEDAIWSHRWYAFYNGIGSYGPTGLAQFGGLEFKTLDGSQKTNVFVGDYTIQPENGGLGVFAHEFGHDLGLPDHYDTSYMGENSSAFWNLMSSGSYLGDGSANGIGTTPGDMSAWDKLSLGWLNYDVARAGQRSTHRLGPAETNTKAAQGLFVVLPKSKNGTTTPLGTPTSGSKAYWSGAGSDLDSRMTLTRAIDLTSATAPVGLSMKAWFEMETCWDYAYVRVSDDGGATWANLATNLSSATNENGNNLGDGITGISGSPNSCDEYHGSPSWVDLTADLSPYAGESILLQVRYATDSYVNGRGFEVDDIAVTANGSTIFADDAESTSPWTMTGGFATTTGSMTRYDSHYYVAEYRQYRQYDAGLRTGPYNFGFLNTRPDWVEHFPYQDGLLISYWDTGFGEDNNVGAHPGEGFLLPIDAHPAPLRKPDSTPARTRIQVYDATFGTEPTDAVTLHFNSVAKAFPSLPAKRVFDDTDPAYFNPGVDPKSGAGVKLPRTGTIVEVVQTNTQGNFMEVNVKPK